jgi:hypothetical protein
MSGPLWGRFFYWRKNTVLLSPVFTKYAPLGNDVRSRVVFDSP